MSLFSFFSPRPAYKVFGPNGGIDIRLTLPEGFDPARDRCPLVLLMHGFISNKNAWPLPVLADSLAREGIASLRFDFDAHGKSEGKFIDMTVSSEIADARAVAEYVHALPFVTRTAFLGHSQGGVIAGMLAGELENSPMRPDGVVLLAPAAVLKDDALKGRCMFSKYDAANPPEYVSVLFHKLGRKFILEAQQLPIYETSAKYSGKVCIIHGKKDKIVPWSYGQRYHETYGDSELHLLEKEGHMLNGDKKSLVASAVSFLKERFQ